MTPGVAIHFAFPDGALAYDCSACDQRCCRTGTLAVFPRERERLIRMTPALELVAPASDAPIALFATPRSGCWFLAGARCRLATAHGGALRPLACSLFPFNLFGLHGDALVVAPNPLCPLDARPGAGTPFADVSSLLASVGAAGEPPAPLRVGDPPDALALERLLRDAAGAALGDPSPVPLLALAAAATRAFARRGLDGLRRLAPAEVDDEVAAVDDRLARAAHILGIEPPGPEAWRRASPAVAAWMPALRLFSFEATPLGRLDRSYEALALYAAHACALAPGRSLLPQTLSQLAGSVGPLCRLVSAWDEPWGGAPVPSLGLGPGASLASVEPRLPDDGVERTAALWRLVAAREAVP